MQKFNLTNSLTILEYDEADYLEKNKKICDILNKIFSGFDEDDNTSFAREYLDNLNGDIFLSKKKIRIFLLKQNTEYVSFLIFDNNQIKLIWTNNEYAKLGFATILLRATTTILFEDGVRHFDVEIEKENLIGQSLFESFGKVDGVVVKRDEKAKIKYNFDIENIDVSKILQDIKNFAI